MIGKKPLDTLLREEGSARLRDSDSVTIIGAICVRLFADSVKKIIECSPAVLRNPPPAGVPGHDYGHPVRVAAYHCSPLAVITPADKESSGVQLACDPLQLIA